MSVGLTIYVSNDEFQKAERVFERMDLAFAALKSKWQRFKNLTPKERFEKSAAFLARRGFPFDIIRKTFEKIEEDRK